MAAHKISISLLKSLLPNSKYFLSLFQQMLDNHGDVLYFEIGKKRAYIIKHPDYAKRILLDNYTNYVKGEPFEKLAPYTGDGIAGMPDYEQWRKQRHILSP